MFLLFIKLHPILLECTLFKAINLEYQGVLLCTLDAEFVLIL